MRELPKIDLATPLTLRSSFAFPLQSPLARREVLLGALWLLVPFVGWLLNMGHRIVMTHRMQRGLPAWPAWTNYPALFKHGCIALAALACSFAVLLFFGIGFLATSVWFWQVAGFSFSSVFSQTFHVRNHSISCKTPS